MSTGRRARISQRIVAIVLVGAAAVSAVFGYLIAPAGRPPAV